MRDSGEASGVRAYDDVLGYLLKHAHLALEQQSDAALADVGVTSRELGVLRVIAGARARSQQEIAALLGVDRTSMVALIDALEHRGVVARRPFEQDRRRNVVELTGDGWVLFREAESLSEQVERTFASPLGDTGGESVRRALRTVLGAHRRD